MVLVVNFSYINLCDMNKPNLLNFFIQEVDYMHYYIFWETSFQFSKIFRNKMTQETEADDIGTKRIASVMNFIIHIVCYHNFSTYILQPFPFCKDVQTNQNPKSHMWLFVLLTYMKILKKGVELNSMILYQLSLLD